CLCPGTTCRPVRPDPPKPISRPSSSTVSTPRSARCSAVLSPAYPPPMTSTSARAEPCSGAVSGGSAAVAAHSECDSGYGACAMMRGSLHGMQDAMQEILRARMLRLVQYIARGALLYHHAAINEQHAIGDFTRKTHFVSHHDHGHALFGKLAHHAQHISHQFGIEGGGRLVEQDRLGLHGQGARDRDALLLATRQLRRMRMLLVRQPHAGQQFATSLDSLRTRLFLDIYGAFNHVFQRGTVGKQIEPLEHHGNLRADGDDGRRIAVDLLAVDEIGRASCRERVCIWGVGECGERKMLVTRTS